MTPKIASAWSRIQKWYSTKAQTKRLLLAKGASEAEIQTLETQLGLKLPGHVRQSYLLHNGSNEISVFEYGYYLLSLSQIYEEWSKWKQLVEDGTFNSMRVSPIQGVKDAWWNTKWIPITTNGGGDHDCIDMDPGSNGNKRQVSNSHTKPALGVSLQSHFELGFRPSQIALRLAGIGTMTKAEASFQVRSNLFNVLGIWPLCTLHSHHCSCRHAAASFDKQRHLADLIHSLDWHFDMERGLLSFGDRYQWHAHVLGTESEENADLALGLGQRGQQHSGLLPRSKPGDEDSG